MLQKDFPSLEHPTGCTITIATVMTVYSHLAMYRQYGAPGQVPALCSRCRGKEVLVQDTYEDQAGCVLCHILEDGEGSKELVASMVHGCSAGCGDWTHGSICTATG